jgi:hypothetical protein
MRPETGWSSDGAAGGQRQGACVQNVRRCGNGALASDDLAALVLHRLHHGEEVGLENRLVRIEFPLLIDVSGEPRRDDVMAAPQSDSEGPQRLPVTVADVEPLHRRPDVDDQGARSVG